MKNTSIVRLPEQEREISALHEKLVRSARTSLEDAMRIGELLCDVKETLDHGQWLPWVKGLPFSRQTADNYRRVFENKKMLSVGKMDLVEAYRALATGRAANGAARKVPAINVEVVEDDAADEDPPLLTEPYMVAFKRDVKRPLVQWIQSIPAGLRVTIITQALEKVIYDNTHGKLRLEPQPCTDAAGDDEGRPFVG